MREVTTSRHLDATMWSTYGWLGQHNLDPGQLAALAARHAKGYVVGRLAEEQWSDELISAISTATKHLDGVQPQLLGPTLRAVRLALLSDVVDTAELDRYAIDESTAFERVAACEGALTKVRSGDLRHVPTLWEAAGWDTELWPPEPFTDVASRPLPTLEDLPLDSMVGTTVIVTAVGDVRIEGKLRSTTDTTVVVSTHTDERSPVSCLARIERSQIISIGPFIELLPWRLLDELEAA